MGVKHKQCNIRSRLAMQKKSLRASIPSQLLGRLATGRARARASEEERKKSAAQRSAGAAQAQAARTCSSQQPASHTLSEEKSLGQGQGQPVGHTGHTASEQGPEPGYHVRTQYNDGERGEEEGGQGASLVCVLYSVTGVASPVLFLSSWPQSWVGGLLFFLPPPYSLVLLH